MQRKLNSTKCTYILAACIIANAILSNAQFTTNETDQSAEVQTEKIIYVRDVSQTTNRVPTTTTLLSTASSSTVDFMNEPSATENGNAAGDVNDTTIIPTKSTEDETAMIVDMINAKIAAERRSGNDRTKSFPQDFDFNLDDLEDLNEHQTETLDGGDDDVVDVVTDGGNRFEELTLDEVTSASDGRQRVPDVDRRNVYRVAKSKSKPPILDSSALTSRPWSNGNVSSFKLFTEMFDQYRWNVNNIVGNVSSKCGLDMETYLNALNSEVEWALKASDASGRYRGQLLFGNDFWVGSKQFCFEINSEREAAKPVSKQPIFKFFVAQILFNVSIPTEQLHALQLAQCLPQSCTINDIRNILNSDPTSKTLKSMSPTNQIKFLDLRTVPGPYDLWTDRRFQLLASIFIIIGLVVIIATIYELSTTSNSTTASSTKHHLSNGNGIHTLTNENLNHKYANGKQLELHHLPADNNNTVTDAGDVEHSKRMNGIGADGKDEKTEKVGIPQQLLLSFSLPSNARAILSADKLSQDSVTCIHGMRVFSMLWTIMVHTYLQTFGISENKYQKTMTERGFFFQIIGNANYAVDTFFYLSGLLVTLLFLRSADKLSNKKQTIATDTKQSVLLFLYRYLRLTPAYFVALLISEVSFKDTYNNSVFPYGLTDHLTCPTHWWRNMLYIQNWFPFPELCMIWSWYLANDMQFYIWAVIILILSTRHFKTSVTLVFAFLLGSWVISAAVSLNVNYIFRISNPLESFGYLYDQVYTRIGPYIMGMIAGYIINRFKEPPKVSSTFNIFMWFVSMATLSLCVFGIWNGSLDRIDTAFYISLGHTAWGFALIWITLSCKWGLAQPINDFLSYPAFLPLSRLTYCTYLLHPITQVVTSFQMQGPLHIRHLMVFTIFLGNAVISYVCAFIASVMFEAPVVRILRVIFRK
ncbi:O-acyltransferase like protein [Bradysia coprophila]|uniref:O-acyltransferase like protein n=1 Tax=Bradysia coprophila TaxID=38358 RepID=UPI00187DB723|nr:O-acyltransferase like protein [Bradysia coprophila]